MTLKPELINAILSMDAYNRGYQSAVELDDAVVGGAQIVQTINSLGETVNLDSSVLNSSDQSIGFYALAYDTDGDGEADVIAYRGTALSGKGHMPVMA